MKALGKGSEVLGRRLLGMQARKVYLARCERLAAKEQQGGVEGCWAGRLGKPIWLEVGIGTEGTAYIQKDTGV